MSRMPSVSKIKKEEWRTEFESGLVKVEIAEVYLVNTIGSKYEICSRDTHRAFDADFYRVTCLLTNKKKIFWGETAWMDARRFAGDLDSGARHY
jgi:hypothetical protein